MGELATYTLTDFIPVTPEIYLRLIVRHNLAVWPAHLLTLSLGGFVLYRLFTGKRRYNGLLLGITWAWVAITYHIQLYANLNWFATYFGYAFLVEALLFISSEWYPTSDRGRYPSNRTRYLGLGLGLFSLVGYPMIAPLTGQAWPGVHVFGISPDATAVGTLAFILLLPGPRWFLTPIPALWCVFSSLESWGLDLHGGVVPLAMALLTILFSWMMDAFSPRTRI